MDVVNSAQALGTVSLRQRAAASVHLIGGRLWLDFVNSVGARRTVSGVMFIRDEKLSEYADLIAWGWHAGILSRAGAARLLRVAARRPASTGRIFKRAIHLRESLHRIALRALVGAAPYLNDLKVFNREVSIARRAERLVWHRRSAVWRWSAEPPAPDRIVSEVALSAADFFTHADPMRLRVCGGDDCGWLFEDVSRNGRRRWCDMRDCGNVAKVRRFRRRLRQRKD